MEQRKAKTKQIKETTMMEGISHLKGTSQQWYNLSQSWIKRRKAYRAK
jgi:hypothetical protein